MSELFEWQAAERIGEKVLEMADRLSEMAAIIPGAEMKWRLEIDDAEYECVMRRVSPPPSTD